jgi:XTP/dITP diphosphohydrolase
LPRPLVLGSSNPDKQREMTELLEGLGWEVRSLGDFDPIAAPEETGTTFEENAALKARYYSDATGIACVADDSGLVVDALDGAPGIYSARFAGPDANAGQNNAKLLELLQDIPWHERTARFVCCAAFAAPGQDPQVVRGEVEGHIAMTPSGAGGFGYDPLFVPQGQDTTFGEMTASAKHALSHRGRALQALRKYLEGQA